MDFTPPPGFEPHHRFDFFEPGDKTALLCLDVPEMQRFAIDQLAELGFKIHTGMFLDDSVLKLRAHMYDVIVVSEHFSGSSLGEHPILEEMSKLSAAQRRRQLFVLIGASLRTNDELQAFSHNVNVVVSLADVVNLRPVIRRAINRTTEFYVPLHEVLSGLNGFETTAKAAALPVGR